MASFLFKPISVLLVLVLYFSYESQGQSSKSLKEHLARAADRVSLALTGDLANPEQRALVADRKLTLKDYAESLRTLPETESHVLQYWLAALKINSPAPLSLISTEPTPVGTAAAPARVTLGGDNTGPFLNSKDTKVLAGVRLPACSSTVIYQRVAPGMVVYSSAELDQRRTTCDMNFDNSQLVCANLTGVAKTFCDSHVSTQPGLVACNSLTGADLSTCTGHLVTAKTNCLAAVEALRRSTTDYQGFLAERQCSCTEAIELFPWWDNRTKVKACPDAVSSCGTSNDLAQCVVQDNRFSVNHNKAQSENDFKYNSMIINGFTEEPGRIFARTILENREWKTALTTSESVMNGAMEHFLVNRGKLIRTNAPSSAYPTTNLVVNDPTRSSFRWVDRGAEMAGGVLTTVAYQLNTNGYRAKVNRAYEAMLCRQFVIPPGTPSTEGTEADLTQRNPCSSCHKIIEPLGKYFWKWDKVSTNFIYHPSANSTPTQHTWPDPTVLKNADFGDFTGSDVVGFGNALATHPNFATCAVKRAFEMVLGRLPEGPELAEWQPRLLQTYTSSGGRIWPVMLQLFESDLFLGGLK